MHQRGVEAKSERRNTDKSQVQVHESCSSQFLTGPLLTHARNLQDCVRREEAQHEGEEDEASDQPSEEDQENQFGQGDRRKGVKN